MNTAEAEFHAALRNFLQAGWRLVEKWDNDGFNADEAFPLPARIKPPLSLDEWFDELQAHYEGPHIIDMERVCDILAEKYNIHAYVEQTGGGCATIYAGTTHPDDEGEDRYQAAAGPGWFAGPGWTKGRGDLADFSIGYDDNGESEPIFAKPGWTEQTIADEINTLITGEVVLANSSPRSRGEA